MFYWDEELQGWIDDETGEIEVPEPPREELKYRNEPPSPPSMGLSGKYVMGKLPNDYVPEERPSDALSMPSMLTPKDYGDPEAGSGPYDPEASAMITGYGKNLMLRKAGKEQPWLTAGGNIASPDYVQDIERTMSALDSGEMSETQLKQKIKANELGGIPKPPTEAELKTFEDILEWKNMKLEDLRGFATEQAQKDWEVHKQGKGLPWQALNKDKFLDEQGKYYMKTGTEHLTKIADQYRAIMLENAKQKLAPKTTTDLVKGALREELGREPSAKEVLDRTAKYNAESAGIKSAAVEKGKKDTQLGLLDPETLKIEGVKFATTGKMTAMGMGGGPYIRTAIMNAAADYLKENNVDPKNVPAMQTEYNAAAQAFTSIKKSTEQVKGFENGLIKNAEYALELSKDVFRTDAIPVNKVINYFKTQTGDPEIVKFGAAIYAAAMEYEKIRTAGTGITSAELSIGAQKKAEEIMNKSMTHKQLGAVIVAMKQDAQNIMEGRTETLRTMDKQMRQLDSMFRGVSGGDGGGEISPKDLEYTAKKHGISVEEVKRRIASKQRKR